MPKAEWRQELQQAARAHRALRELDADTGTEKTRIARARKMFLGCVDCGYRRHPEALQFDHRPGAVKVANISGWQGDIPSMLIEMNKCDVVCANCHAIRTALRRSDETASSAKDFRFSAVPRDALRPSPPGSILAKKKSAAAATLRRLASENAEHLPS